MAAGAVAVLVLTGCTDKSARADDRATPTYLVSGTLAQVGGPAGNPPAYPDGTITLRSASGVVTTAARAGRFSVRVAPGTYAVTGRAPTFGDDAYECRADTRVTVDRDVSGVRVLCQMR